MNPFYLVLIVILVLIYIAFPFDLLPDVLPITGWIDDIGLLALLIYYMKTGRLPAFISKISRALFGGKKPASGKSGSNQKSRGTGQGSRNTGAKDPYEVLGVKPGASEKEIHDAYRRLVQQYHPDKVSHLGEEFQQLAQKKFVEIQDAYEALTGKRG